MMLENAILIGGLPLLLGAGVFIFLKNSAHNVRHFSMAMTIGVMLPVLFHLLTDAVGGHEHGEVSEQHAHHSELLENLLVWFIMVFVFWGLHRAHRMKTKISLGLSGTLALAAAFHHIPEGILIGDIIRNDSEHAYRTILGLSMHHFAEALAIVSLLVYEKKSLKTLGFISVILIFPLYAGMAYIPSDLEYLNVILSAIGAGALAHVIFDTLIYLQTQGKQCCSSRLINFGYVAGIAFSVIINVVFEVHI